MKRSGIILPLLLLIIGAAAILGGCTAENLQSAATTQAEQSGSTQAEQSSSTEEGTAVSEETTLSTESETIIDRTAVFPAAYSITYEVTDEQGRITTMRKVRDESGNLYLQNGNEQSLYLWDGHAYSLYISDSDGGFILSEDNTAYTESYVEDAASFFDEYAEKGNDRFITGAAEQGTQTYLNRICTVFTISIGSDSNGMTCTFLADNETGLCLSWQNEAHVGGYDVGSDAGTLTCVEFTTEEVPNLQEWV